MDESRIDRVTHKTSSHITEHFLGQESMWRQLVRRQLLRLKKREPENRVDINGHRISFGMMTVFSNMILVLAHTNVCV